MKHRLLLHNLNHTILCVDISSVGIPVGIISDEGETKTLPSIRFRSWSNAEPYFLGLGASRESLSTTEELVKKNGVAVLTITYSGRRRHSPPYLTTEGNQRQYFNWLHKANLRKCQPAVKM